MVSSVLGIDVEDLLRALARLSVEHEQDPEYRQWRAQFPPDWPM